MGTEKGQKTGYKDTLNLPRTGFSMKANLPVREPDILKKWEEQGIYDLIMKKREPTGKKFILHDGPPYANGHIHMGHVLNKILKDMCIKYRSMNGYMTPYVPGWDCHGLPVELQLLKELKITKHEIDQVEFRNKAYDYAMKYVGIQAEEFQRLGVLGEWNAPYLTLTREYESDILYALSELYEKGYIYKDLKPVNWCGSCETALAEAEVEYEDKTSPSIFVKFRTDEKMEGKPVSFAVWTTTPWTLIANVAVALHPEFDYGFYDTGEEVLIVCKDLAESVFEKTQIEGAMLLSSEKGAALSGRIKKAVHPFLDRGSVVVTAGFVTAEEGAGCVHIAPGHGQDDFLLGKELKLPVIMPVDDKGLFVQDIPDLGGKHVFKANGQIIEKMMDKGTLLKQDQITHSYPHCWRCKKPIIFRATEQWFMSIDHKDLRKKMMKTIDDDVRWVPDIGRERIKAMVEGRPDWCLSRQRYWGVPIPSFKCGGCGKVFTDASIIRRIAELTREKGSNVWFSEGPDKLAPEGTVCPDCGKQELLKEQNILDVWFDSGISHKAVLDTNGRLGAPADLYLEGSDQHRGWFQSALITSMGMRGEAPYRQVLTHGFVVDGEGKKMSKSVGNVIRPDAVMKRFGADILRLWVASSDYEGDIKLSSEILERLADGYRKIRNTFRFLLSNLYDFEPGMDGLATGDMKEIDRWMLSRLYKLTEDVTGNYERYEFHKVYRTVYNFCVYEVSAFYLDALKDILYVEAPSSRERRSAQTGIYNVLNVLVRLLAPVIPFTAEEVWGNMPAGHTEESVHISDWPGLEKELDAWKSEELDSKWDRILKVREEVLKVLEVKREEGIIGSSLEALVSMYSEDPSFNSFLKEKEDLFPLLLKVSKVRITSGPGSGMEEVQALPLHIQVDRADGKKCERCWNYSASVGSDKDKPDICGRCSATLASAPEN